MISWSQHLIISTSHHLIISWSCDLLMRACDHVIMSSCHHVIMWWSSVDTHFHYFLRFSIKIKEGLSPHKSFPVSKIEFRALQKCPIHVDFANCCKISIDLQNRLRYSRERTSQCLEVIQLIFNSPKLWFWKPNRNAHKYAAMTQRTATFQRPPVSTFRYLIYVG